MSRLGKEITKGLIRMKRGEKMPSYDRGGVVNPSDERGKVAKQVITRYTGRGNAVPSDIRGVLQDKRVGPDELRALTREHANRVTNKRGVRMASRGGHRA